MSDYAYTFKTKMLLDKMEKNKYWDGKKVLITGGTGYLGSGITKELLNNGSQIICLTNKAPEKNSYFNLLGLTDKVKIIIGDILDLDLIKAILKEHNIENVFHLAGQPIVSIGLEKPLETIKINVIGTANVLEACRLNGNIKSIVVASSIHAYDPKSKMPFAESSTLKGIGPYEVSKSFLDIMSQTYAKTYNLPIGITRASNIYGEGEIEFNRLVSKIIKNTIHNNKIKIVYGGRPKRGFLYIKDIIQGNIVLSEKIEKLGIKGEAFNFGSDKPYEIIGIVNKILEIGLKKGYPKPELEIVDEPIKDEGDLYHSSEKAKKVLGWDIKYDIDRGLKETFEWYENYLRNMKI